MNCAEFEQLQIQQGLWKPVDKPCGKPALDANTRSVSKKDKSFYSREAVVDALTDAVELLAARVEALEYEHLAFLSVLDKPLSPAESLEQLRRLRDELV